MDESIIPEKKDNKDSFMYRLKQQMLSAWIPIPTITFTIITVVIIGAIFLTFGIILFQYSKDINEVEIKYSESKECTEGNIGETCRVTFQVEDKIKEPVFIYYQLNNFYQNHRKYVKSIDFDQLKGSVKSADSLGLCDPIETMNDLGLNKSIDGTFLPGSAPANPCGLIAKSFFNDTYKIYKENKNIPIDEKNIAWQSDKDKKFKRPDNYQKIQWIDVENEHFIVWMRVAAFPSFRKLWGRIEQDIEPGVYELEIENNYNTWIFDGDKYVVLSNANIFGGKNVFLAIAYIVIGVVALFIGVCLLGKFIYDKVKEKKKVS